MPSPGRGRPRLRNCCGPLGSAQPGFSCAASVLAIASVWILFAICNRQPRRFMRIDGLDLASSMCNQLKYFDAVGCFLWCRTPRTLQKTPDGNDRQFSQALVSPPQATICLRSDHGFEPIGLSTTAIIFWVCISHRLLLAGGIADLPGTGGHL